MKKIKVSFLGEGDDIINVIESEGKEQGDKNTQVPPVVISTPKSTSVEMGNTQALENKDGNDIPLYSKNDIMELVKKINEENRKAQAPVAQSNDSQDLLAKAILALTSLTNSKETGTRLRNMEEIDSSDYLDVPVLFFCYSSSRTIYDDVRKNQAINAPYNRPIHFQNVYRKEKEGVSKEKAGVICMSATTVTSKKQLDFLTSHSEYKISFFKAEEMSGKAVDSERADALAFASRSISSLDEGSMLRRAMSEGVAIDSQDPSVVKRKLVEKIADNYQAENEKRKVATSKKYVEGLDARKNPFPAEQLV